MPSTSRRYITSANNGINIVSQSRGPCQGQCTTIEVVDSRSGSDYAVPQRGCHPFAGRPCCAMINPIIGAISGRLTMTKHLRVDHQHISYGMFSVNVLRIAVHSDMVCHCCCFDGVGVYPCELDGR